jgi:serine/threonine-protein kinase
LCTSSYNPAAGRAVATERFAVLERLGHGGMGTVWKARDNRSGVLVALKILHEMYADDPDYLKRFEREIAAARRVDSPQVVKVLGHGRRDGVPFIVMEFAAGATLRNVLRDRWSLPWGEDFAPLRSQAHPS